MKTNVIFIFSCLLFLGVSTSLTAQTSCRENFPVFAHFETGFFFWDNVSGDDFDWIRQSGSTPTTGTGPDAAAAGQYYAYVEATGHLFQEEAILESPCLDLRGKNNAYLGFRYHAKGADVGQLYVEAKEEGTSTWQSLWSIDGAQGNDWNYQRVDLDGWEGKRLRLRFRANTGPNLGDLGDIAIDAPYLYADEQPTACSGPVYTGLSEGFEGTAPGWSTTGDWVQSLAVDGFTGPFSSCEGAQNMRISPASSNSTNSGTLDGPCVTLDNPLTAQVVFCSFFERVTTATGGQGHLYVDVSTNDGSTWTQVFARTTESSVWETHSISLTDYVNQNVRVRFRGEVGDNNFLCVDHVRMGSMGKTGPLATGGEFPWQVSVSPQPASRQMQVDWGELQDHPVQVDLYSLQGQLLRSEVVLPTSGRSAAALSVATLPAGSYVLRLVAGEQAHRQVVQVID